MKFTFLLICTAHIAKSFAAVFLTAALLAGAAEPPRPQVIVIENGKPKNKPAECRGSIVGPGVNQPNAFSGYAGFVGWESPVRPALALANAANVRAFPPATFPGSFVAAGARAPATLKSESFDRDPGWEGRNNRVVPKDVKIVTQDFGYSATHFAGKGAGEIGGRIQRSTTPATYAAKIAPRTLDDKLNASGSFAITSSQGSAGLFFGYFNSQQPGGSGRPIGSLGMECDFEESGGRMPVRLITGGNKSCGTFITPFISGPGGYRPTPLKNDGTRYHWTLDYDPQAAGGNGRYTFALRSDNHPIPPPDTKLTAAAQAEVRSRFPHTTTFTVDLTPGLRKEGANFDRFGVINMMKAGGAATIFFDDVRYDGQTQDFSADPGWIGAGNRVVFADREVVGAHDFGFSAATSHTGSAAGEIGGGLWRSGDYAYYADRVGTLDLEQRLEARGKLKLITAGPDSEIYLGWFSSVEKEKEPAETGHFIGVHIGGPTNIGHYFNPRFATGTGTLGKVDRGPVLAHGKVFDWALIYDPAANNNLGELRATLGTESVTLALKPGEKAQGASLDRFGLFNSTAGGQMVKIYLDDLHYTAAPATAPGRALDIGNGPQLFLDDYVIEKREGLKREVQSPQRHGPPVLDSKTFGVTQPYLTVLRDAETQRFRMFYNSGPSFWHAESEDGIRWTNPHVAWERRRGYGCSIVDDGEREPDPSRRFKAAHWSSTIDDKPGDDGGMWVGFSPDGCSWTLADKNPVLWTWPEGWDNYVSHGVGDTMDVYYDPIAKCYRVAIKVNAVAADGYAPAPRAGKTFRRLIGMSTSKDFTTWEKPWRIHVPDEKDEGLLEFYGMGGMHLRGGLHIGLVRVLRDDLPCDPGGPIEGLGYTALATSRDGVTWHRDREPFLDRNPVPGSWDHAMAWMSDAVPVGDEVLFYYGGYARGHKIEAKTERQIGLARMKKDRYVALSSGPEQGTLLTRPFLLPEGKLTLNARAAPGEVRVRLLSEDCLISESHPITSDALAVEVQWVTPPAALKGQPVRLELTVRNAAVFGFEFHPSR